MRPKAHILLAARLSTFLRLPIAPLVGLAAVVRGVSMGHRFQKRQFHILLGLPLLAIPLLAGSCGEDASSPSVTPTPRINLQLTASPDEYFDLFPFHLDWVREAIGSTPSREDGPTYHSALQKLRDGGMEALSKRERRLIVVVSWYAKVMQTQTVRYREEVRDQQGDLIQLTETEELYEFRLMEGMPAPYLVGFRSSFLQKSAAHSPDESISKFETTDDMGEEDAVQTAWWRYGDSWVCDRVRSSGPHISGVVHPELPAEFAAAAPDGVEEVNGRRAYRLKAGPSSSIGPFPEYLWLDVDTLVPVQEQYDEGLGNHSIKTILESNGEVNVEPPDVSVSCTERDLGE